MAIWIESSVVPTAPSALTRVLAKDLAVFTPRDRVFVFGIFFLASLETVLVDEVFLWLGLALAGALTLYVPVIEWFQETDPMLHSLPVRRATVVLARYVTAMFAMGIAGVAWVSTGWLLGPLLAAGRESPALWMTMEGVLTFLVAFGLLVSLFLPLYFRLGLGRSTLAFMGLSPILVLLGYASSGVAWGPGVGGSAGAGGLFPFLPPSSLVSARVEALVGGVGPGWALAFIIVGIGLVLAFSERLSVRWCEKREF